MASGAASNWRVVLLLVLASSSTVHALTPSQVFDAVKDSVVVIKSLDAKGEAEAMGSGVLLPSGKIATNCHVLKDGTRFQVGRGKQFVTATVYAGDGDKDICLLDAQDIGGKPATLGKTSSLKVGAAVYAVGAPQGLELSLSDGIVSQLRGSAPPIIQTTAAISPGSSGGGLFDSEGRLVGLTTLYIDGGQNLNFAMPVEWLAEIKPGKKAVSGQRNQIDWFTRAVALEEKKDWPGLLAWGKQWVKAEPGNSTAWFSIGFAHHELNQPDPAIVAYRQALRINPEHAFAWYNLGITYHDLKRFDDAIAAYRQALRIDPEYSFAWNNLGTTYADLKRTDDAISAFREALRIDPENAAAWFNLGIAYTGLERHDEAIAAYRQVLRINPEHADAWFNLGRTYIELKRFDDAIPAYLQMVRIVPKHDKAWFNLGNAYFGVKRFDDAISAYLQAVRINQKHIGAWNNLAYSYYRSGNKAAALKAVEALRTLDPAKAEKLFNVIVPR